MSEVKSVRFHAATDKMPANVDVQQFHALRLTDDKTGIVVTDSAGNALGVVLPVSGQAPADVIDTASTADNASRDAVALVASLRKNDKESAGLLLGFYDNDAKAQAALCSSLADFACACLATIDNVRQHFHVTDGVVLPSGDDVLKTVMLKLAEPQPQPSPDE